MEDKITVKEAKEIALDAFNRGFRHGRAIGHTIIDLAGDEENMAFKEFCKDNNLNERDI